MDADRCCVACDFYAMPKPVGAVAAGHIPPGFCHRFPQAVQKAINDWCGEHSSRGAKPAKGGK